MDKVIREIIYLGTIEPMPLANLHIKLSEEVGELGECINHHQGFLPHKEMKEPIAGEVADVINTTIAILAHAYPDLSEDQVFDLLNEQLTKKNEKWSRVIGIRRQSLR